MVQTAAGRLDEARSKLERAKLHTKQIERDIAGFGGTVKPYTEESMLTGSFHESEGYFSVGFSDDPLPVPPPDISLTIGDAVHNLRCALDYLAWQLVDKGSATKPLDEGVAIGVQFPIVAVPAKGKTLAETFDGQSVRRLPGVGNAEVDLVRQWQPFVTNPADPEGESLAQLNRLSNHDKHRSLRSTRLAVSNLVPDPIEANPYFVITNVEPLSDTYTPGAEFFRIHGHRTGKGLPAVRVGFPDTALTVIYEHVEVGVTSVLHDARKAIAAILDAFGPLLGP